MTLPRSLIEAAILSMTLTLAPLAANAEVILFIHGMDSRVEEAEEVRSHVGSAGSIRDEEQAESVELREPVEEEPGDQEPGKIPLAPPEAEDQADHDDGPPVVGVSPARSDLSSAASSRAFRRRSP